MDLTLALLKPTANFSGNKTILCYDVISYDITSHHCAYSLYSDVAARNCMVTQKLVIKIIGNYKYTMHMYSTHN